MVRKMDRVGLVCAGGQGTRLWPLTISVNKHLMPIYDKPMLHYPISVLMLAGIREIVVVTTPDAREPIQAALRAASSWGLNIIVRTQDEANGIVGCILAADDLIRGRRVCVVLGDNFFYGSRLSEVLSQASGEASAVLVTAKVAMPEAFAVVARGPGGAVTFLEEKPTTPQSNEVATGLYFYPDDLAQRARTIGIGSRGELEITDLNRTYLRDGLLLAKQLPRGTVWFDCGTHTDLQRASALVETLQSLRGIRVSCLEEIAWRHGWINSKQLKSRIETVPDADYAHYLAGVAQEAP